MVFQSALKRFATHRDYGPVGMSAPAHYMTLRLPPHFNFAYPRGDIAQPVNTLN